MTEKKDVVEQAITKVKPVLANIGMGSIVGFTSGLAMKKVGKALAVVIGTGFIGLQVASACGYIEVKWDEVGQSAKKKMDANQDGVLDTKDVKEWWVRLKKLLEYKLPSAGGFSLGFLYGVSM